MATSHQQSVPGGKALELTMRDAQLGLQDVASYFAFTPAMISFEILSLLPPSQPVITLSQYPANVVNLSMARSHDIVSFLFRQESYLERCQIQS